MYLCVYLWEFHSMIKHDMGFRIIYLLILTIEIGGIGTRKCRIVWAICTYSTKILAKRTPT